MLSLPMLLGGAFLIWRGLREPLPAVEAAPAPQPAETPPAVEPEDPFRIRPAPGSDGPA